MRKQGAVRVSAPSMSTKQKKNVHAPGGRAYEKNKSMFKRRGRGRGPPTGDRQPRVEDRVCGAHSRGRVAVVQLLMLIAG